MCQGRGCIASVPLRSHGHTVAKVRTHHNDGLQDDAVQEQGQHLAQALNVGQGGAPLRGQRAQGPEEGGPLHCDRHQTAWHQQGTQANTQVHTARDQLPSSRHLE